jgi:hypothetical protein
LATSSFGPILNAPLTNPSRPHQLMERIYENGTTQSLSI